MIDFGEDVKDQIAKELLVSPCVYVSTLQNHADTTVVHNLLISNERTTYSMLKHGARTRSQRVVVIQVGRRHDEVLMTTEEN
jgi:hypothetical protein